MQSFVTYFGFDDFGPVGPPSDTFLILLDFFLAPVFLVLVLNSGEFCKHWTTFESFLELSEESKTRSYKISDHFLHCEIMKQF